MAGKPIDKNYLVNTLKSFNEQVLNSEYAKKGEIVEGHTHENKSTIDKLSETSDGVLLFDGNEIKGGLGEPGQDGITPHIDENSKHWMIGDTDTGVLAEGTPGKDGQDGKSIKSITKDENNNIITTFTDGTTQNIGQLSIDVQSDFLTEDGFGNLRYYNGHFQYYDDTTSSWIDTSISPDNVYIMNMTPQTMNKIFCVYDTSLQKYNL